MNRHARKRPRPVNDLTTEVSVNLLEPRLLPNAHILTLPPADIAFRLTPTTESDPRDLFTPRTPRPDTFPPRRRF
jgi:hypothetical protein